MKINCDIIDDFIQTGTLESVKDHWIFDAIEEGRHLFSPPNQERVTSLKHNYELMIHALYNFKPFNLELWEALYGKFEGISDDLTVFLIVGSPDPYDAMVRQAPDGTFCIIFDIERISCYAENEKEMLFILKNLITHEYAHILNRSWMKQPNIGSSFKEQLGIMALDEGIAHALSISENVLSVNWLDEKYVCRKKEAYRRFIEEQNQETSETNEERLIKANSGSGFWEKYGSISGMFAVIDFVKENKDNIALLKENGAELIVHQIENTNTL